MVQWFARSPEWERRLAWRGGLLQAVLLSLVLLFAGACQADDIFDATPEAQSPFGSAPSATEQAQTQGTQDALNLNEPVTIPLHVVRGPAGSVLALIPVMVQGEGPYTFALDTGASRSVIDQQISNQLELETVGQASDVIGVTGTSQANIVRVSDWMLDQALQLPETELAAIDLPGQNRQTGIQGLLGSDILSQFGAITIDYEQEELILQPQ